MLWTEDTRQYKTSAFCSKCGAASHLTANFLNFPRRSVGCLWDPRRRGAEDDGWGRMLTVAGLRHLAAANQPFTHWLGRRQIRAKYFQKVVKGSVTELSRSVDCIRCVTALPPPPRPSQHSRTIVGGDQAAKIQPTLQQIMSRCILNFRPTFIHFDHVPQLSKVCDWDVILILNIKSFIDINLSILFNLTKLSKYFIKSFCLFSVVFCNFLCL